MIKKSLSCAVLVISLVGNVVVAQEQEGEAGTSPFDEAFRGVIGRVSQNVKAGDSRSAQRAIEDLSAYVQYLGEDVLRKDFLSEAEQRRLDKQVGNGGSSGGTSLVSKGSAPWLIGLALEHGGLTQTSDTNTITFRGNGMNLLRAVMKGTYQGSYDFGGTDPLIQALSKLSFAVTFDTGASGDSSGVAQGFALNRRQVAAYSFRYEALNHRDPRDRRYHKQWSDLLRDPGGEVNDALSLLSDLIRQLPGHKQWQSDARDAVGALPADASADEVRAVVRKAADTFSALVASNPQVKAALSHSARLLSTYIDHRNSLLSKIQQTPILTVEYNNIRQRLSGDTLVQSTQPMQVLPDLSNINLIFEKGFAGNGAPEFTANASVTWFNSSNETVSTRGSVRDYRFGAQFDMPLREIMNIGKPTLSLSGLFLSLLEEPLGQAVIVNGTNIDRRGNIWVAQAKVSIPVKGSGMKIPIAFTYANRTELIKEKEVRGNVGVTFDLDSIFAKSE